MNSLLKNPLKKLMLIALVLCMPFIVAFSIEKRTNQTAAPTADLSFTQVYNFSTQAGTSQSKGWDATLVRNYAYKDGKLYLVYNNASIKVVDAQTGDFLYDLNTTGVTGGYIVLCDIGVFDGKVVASNLKVTGASTPLKVYVWDNDQSAPRTVLTTYDYGSADRLGDCLGFYGTWTNGQFTFARDDNSATRIVSYKITNGVCTTTPTVVNATYTSGRRTLPLVCGLSVRVQPDATGYWINGTANALTRLDTTGKRLYSVAEYNNEGNSFAPFTFQGRQYALLDTYVGSGNFVSGAMSLIDANNGWQYTEVLGTYPSTGLGYTANTNGTGGVIANAGSNYVQAWVLSSLQGLAYFKYGTPPNSGEPLTPTLSATPASLAFGSVVQNQSKQLTLSVLGENLTGNVSVSSSSSAFTVSPATLGTSGGTVTVTFSPTAQQSYSGTITLSSSGAANLTVNMSGTGTAAVPSISLTEKFNISEANSNASSKGWDATNIRNMTYTAGKLYLVHNHADIKVVKSQSGDLLYDLDKTGISGGALTLCDVGVIDGKVIACNLASSGQTLKVYIWDNDQATPRLLLSTTNLGGVSRIGDCIGVSGTLSSGKLSFAHDSGTSTQIINYTISNGVAQTTPTVISATNADGSYLYCSSSIRVQPDDTGYWINGKGNYLTRLNTSGQKLYHMPQADALGNGFSAFKYNNVQYAVASMFVGPETYQGGAMQLMNAASGWANATAMATYPSAGLGTSLNSGCTGSVCSDAGSNYVEAWVLSTTQGVAYYTYGTPPTYTYGGTTPVTPTLSVSNSSLSFGEVQVNQTKALTFTVTGQDVSGNISVSSSNSTYFSVSPSSLSSSGGTVTVTFKPSAAQSYSATITVSATGATSKTVSVSGTGKTSDPQPTEVTTSHLFTSSYTWNSDNKSRDIAYHNGKVYAIENNGTSSAMHAINGSTGTEITSEKVTNNWFNAFSVSNDGSGNLYVPTNNTGGVSSFVFSKLTLPSAVSAVNNHLNAGAGLRTDFIEAYKANDNLTYLAGATVASSPRRVRVWSVNQLGVISSTKTFTLPTTDINGTGGDVKWINANKILLTGASKVPAILTLNMTSETFTKTEVTTSAVSFGGAAYFKVYGYPYVALPTNGLGAFKVLEVTNPSSPTQVAEITSNIGSTDNGAAHVGMEAVANGNVVTIYVWSPNNGLAAHKLTFPYRTQNPNEEEDPVIPDDPEEDPDEDDGTLQREMRATWLAQVGVDWPSSKATSTSGRTAQKKELTDYMDQLKAANCNAVYFHIRSMADRSYALSSTADIPWSIYLTGTRGSDPGYDPLRFAIDEAHKRGMELHGWMNPYRFPTNTTVPSAMSSWVFTYASGKKILNPGIPAVRQHIADATKDVVQNYPDIDGIVWDDYFYEDGTTDAMDQTAFNSYNPKGLSRGDWRRDNINQTIELVYNTIQSVNPGIRFGISPRGIWGVKQSDANQHGVTLPSGITGADNYNGIYTDGIAWLRYGIIDYISPQLYWATYPTGASGQDYNVLAPWWQSVADMFNRHFYSSIGLYRGFSESEIGREIAKNREVNYKSPGSVFFSTKNFTSYNSYITNNYFQNQILPPAITWKAGSVKPNRVDNVVLNGTTLSWTSDLADGSYAIFAVPKSLGVVSIKHCNYMIHRVWTNNKSFALGSFASLAGTHNFAVAAVNRYNMMSEPKFESYLTTEVEKVENTPAFKIYSNHAGLNIELEQAEQVNIFSLSGVLQYQGYVENTLTINLPQGVYLVKIGSKTVKVVR